tara:strand:+ start:218 stop:673 length:456 start_codon:yes stop_codon:yes gene_type:complete
MAKKYEMFVFHAAAVDGSSVGSADDGTNLDMAAFKLEDLVCITASETTVELMFDETGMFNRNFGNGGADGGDAGGEAIENSLVQLTTTNAATTTAVIKKIVQGINAQSPVYNDGMFLFDAVNDKYPCGIGSGEVSAINIRRTTTTRVTAVA